MTDESELGDLLVQWEEARESGRPVSPEELCGQSPAMLDELRRRVRALEAMEEVLAAPAGQDGSTPLVWDTTESNGAGPGDTAGPPQSRFRPGRHHASGGLGEVFEGQDEELNRGVALKRIKPRFADDPDCRRRFLREAEVTGRLEHPGIVPVYGIGRDGAGRPFYAMRFVRGETLQAAIERFHKPIDEASGARNLAFRDLLGRFVAVCRTIAYAHDQGVLHRDLKPANVMLGPYGETLVLDWGLAKPFAELDAPPSEAPTGETHLTRGAVGTPSYMSPEQAAGAADIGPAADIYLLGATLYSILTGSGPFRGRTAAEAVDRARRGEFISPHQLRRDAPRALEAICLKAMAFRPEERYPSALGLAADVEQWLADEPVGAWREPWAVRARRWLRRHRTASAAGVAALVVGLIGGAFALVLREEARAQARATKQATENLEQVLDRNIDLANELRPVAGAQRESVEKILAVVRGHYQQALDGASQPVSVRERLGRMRNAFAAVYLDLGDTRQAVRDASEAVVLFEGLTVDDPGHADWRRGLATAHDLLGTARRQQGRAAAALQSFDLALALRTTLVDEAADDPDRLGELADSHSRIGLVRFTEMDLPTAEAAYREAFRLRDQVAAADPASPRSRLALARARYNLGGTLAWTDPARGDEAYRAVAATLDTLHPDPAWSADLVRLRFDNGFDMAQGLQARRQPAAARAAYRKCLEQVEPFAQADPQNVDWVYRSFAARVALADLPDDPPTTTRASAYEGLLREGTRLRTLLEARRERDPENAVVAKWLGLVQGRIGMAHAGLADLGVAPDSNRPRALIALREAVRIGEELVRLDPDHFGWVNGLGGAYYLLGLTLRAGGEQEAADAVQVNSSRVDSDFYTRRAARAPDRPEWQRSAATALEKLAGALNQAGRFAEAEAPARRALATLEALAARRPEDPIAQSELADGYNRLGGVLGGSEGAIEAHRKALAIYEKLEKAAPDNPAWVAGQAYSASQLISAYRIHGDVAGGRIAFQRARAGRARATRWKVTALTGPPDAPTSTGVAAMRALFGRVSVGEARSQFAVREGRYKTSSTPDRAIELAEAAIELAEALDRPAGGSEARDLLGRARDLYRVARDPKAPVREEDDAISALDEALKRWPPPGAAHSKKD